jgi:hypothetical protein
MAKKNGCAICGAPALMVVECENKRVHACGTCGQILNAPRQPKPLAPSETLIPQPAAEA